MKKLTRHKLHGRTAKGATYIETDHAKLIMFAKAKIHEELAEVIDSDFTDILEYVDLLDAVEHLAFMHGFSGTDLHNARCFKQAKNGSFSRGVIWDSEGKKKVLANQ